MKTKDSKCSRIFIFFISTILFASSCMQSLSSSHPEEYKEYNNPDWGISFEYPSTMNAKEFTDSRIVDNTNLSLLETQFRDNNEIIEIFLLIIDDPLLASYSDWYPPSEMKLELFAAGELGYLNLDKSYDNNNAVKGALETARFERIAGFPSIQYRVFLTSPDYGYIYVSGAEIITPIRSYSIMVIGGLSKEGIEHETVNAERVDEIWKLILETISIEE